MIFLIDFGLGNFHCFKVCITKVTIIDGKVIKKKTISLIDFCIKRFDYLKKIRYLVLLIFVYFKQC